MNFHVVVLLLALCASCTCKLTAAASNTSNNNSSNVYLCIGTDDAVAEYSLINSDAITESTALWCSYGEGDSGRYLLPNGSEVMEAAGEGSVFVMHHGVGLLGLYRVKPLGDSQGVYTCSVTHSNHSITNLSVVIYDNTTLVNLSAATGDLQYNIVDIQQSIVTLSFTVFAIPPSSITCYTDDVVTDDVIDDVTVTTIAPQYPEVAFNVIVTMTTRQGGAYYCNVGAILDDEVFYNVTTKRRDIPVSIAPGNITVTRTGYQSTLISWLTANSQSLYQLHYHNVSGEYSVAINGSASVTLNDLSVGEYGVHVIAYTEHTLPSISSDTYIIPEVPAPMLSVVQYPPDGLPFEGDSISLTCAARTSYSNSSITITMHWTINDTIIMTDAGLLTDTMYTSTLVLDNVTVSESGAYICHGSLGVDISNNITTTISIQALPADPVVMVTVTGVQNLGHALTLHCSTSNAPHLLTNTIQWILSGNPFGSSNIGPTPSHTTNTSTLYFDLLTPNDVGVYMCQVTIIADGSLRMLSTGDAAIDVMLTTPYNVSLEASNSFSISVTWSDPLQTTPTSYSISINHTSAITTTTVQQSSDGHYKYTMDGLQPYQYVTATVTTDGPSPASVTVSGRTNEYFPGPVDNISVTVIDSSEVVIHWASVVEANGAISHYHIELMSYDNMHTNVDNTSQLHATLTGLKGEVLYNVSVAAVTVGGLVGRTNSITFFTQEGVPYPPSNVTALRLNGSHLLISWNVPQAYRGYPDGYLVIYEGHDVHSVNVDAGTSRVTIATAAPDVMYSVIVGVYNEVGEMFSDRVIVPGPVILQLRGGPFPNCNTDEAVKEVFQSIILRLLNGKALLIDNDTLYCTASDAIYRTNVTVILHYTLTDLVHIISTWISNTSNNTYYTLDDSCPVYISTSTQPLCTDAQTTSTGMGEGDSTILGGIVGTLIILLVLVAVVGVVCCMLLWRLYRKRVKSWTFVSRESPESPQVPADRYRVTAAPPKRCDIPLYRSHSHRIQVFQNTKIDEEEEDAMSDTTPHDDSVSDIMDYGQVRVHETGVYENHHIITSPRLYDMATPRLYRDTATPRHMISPRLHHDMTTPRVHHDMTTPRLPHDIATPRLHHNSSSELEEVTFYV